MRIVIVLLTSFLLSSFGCASSTLAQSQVQIGIRAGIDKDTQEFLLDKLLPKAREQLLLLLKEALPEVDRSIVSYLNRVNEIIKNNIDEGLKSVECTAIGTGALAKDSLKASLVSLIFEKRSDKDLTFANVLRPMQDLNQSISEMRNEVTTRTEVNQILWAYSDLLLLVAIVNCETRFTNMSTIATEVQAAKDRVHLPAMEWQTLVGPSRDNPWCITPADCVAKRQKQIDGFINANKIDAKFTSKDGEFDAAKEFNIAQMQIPEAPKPSVFDSIAPKRIPLVDYENVLSRLRQIERTVTAHRDQRKEDANKLLQVAIEQKNAAVDLVNHLDANFRNPTDIVVDRAIAIDRYPEMRTKTNYAREMAKQALAKDPDLNNEFKKLESELDQNLKNANRLKADAERHLNESRLRAIQERPPRRQF